MKHSISDIIRDAANQREVAPPADLWARVADQLPPQEAKVLPIRRTRVIGLFVAIAVAITLVAVAVVGFFYPTPQASTLADQPMNVRGTVEGSLELEPVAAPTIFVRADIYEGVHIREGDPTVNTLKACNPC